MNPPEVEGAVTYYLQGYTCAQSILASFAERYDLPQSLAFRMGEPFGAGTSCTGGMCGAVSGAIMVLGLAYGSTSCDDDAARSHTYQCVHELIQRFKDLHGSTQCPDLLGYHLGDGQQLQTVREKGLFTQLCPILVRDAAQTLIEML